MRSFLSRNPRALYTGILMISAEHFIMVSDECNRHLADVRDTNKEGCKIIYGEIKRLSFKTGSCNARNSYFATEHGVHPRTIQRWLHTLSEENLIKIKINNKKSPFQRREIYILEKNFKKNRKKG